MAALQRRLLTGAEVEDLDRYLPGRLPAVVNAEFGRPVP